MHKEKFTQGSWVVHYNSADCIEVVIDSSGGIGWSGDDYLCIALSASGDGDDNEHCTNNPLALANAHLISAAPDMYKALKMAQLWLDIDGRYNMQIINKALAKARGEL